VGALLVSQCNAQRGEPLCRLGGWGVGVLLLLGGFFCQGWLERLSKIVDLWSSRCLLPPSSRHLGSSYWVFSR
jgi:hypothetical protein